MQGPGQDVLSYDARVPGWLEHLEANGKMERTRYTYHLDLQKFITYCRYKKTRLEDVDWRFIEGWILHMKNAGLANISINHKIQAMGSFYDYLMRLGDVPHNPRRDVRSLKVERKIPEFLPADTVLRLIQAAPTSMEKALLATLFGTGIRRAEFIGLDTKDVLWDQALLKVRKGKGGKERLVPIPLPCLTALKEWLKERQQILEKNNRIYEQALFVGLTKGRRFHRDTIRLALLEIGEKAGFEKNLHPHLFRHSYATALWNNGVDLRALQVLLGHDHIQTTTIYTHVGVEKLKQAVQALHPMR